MSRREIYFTRINLIIIKKAPYKKVPHKKNQHRSKSMLFYAIINLNILRGGLAVHDNTNELAENKLLMLYIFYNIKFPVTNDHITQIILENDFIDYFTLQQYINDLITSNCIRYTKKIGKNRLIITKKGEKILSLFKDRISAKKLDIIDRYLEKQRQNILNELTITAEYTIENNTDYIVDLKALENESIIVNLKLNVASNKQAIAICKRWKENSSKLYSEIIKLFTED